jgi:hypothetical protein
MAKDFFSSRFFKPKFYSSVFWAAPGTVVGTTPGSIKTCFTLPGDESFYPALLLEGGGTFLLEGGGRLLLEESAGATTVRCSIELTSDTVVSCFNTVASVVASTEV